MFDILFLGTAAAVPATERGLPGILVSWQSRRFLIDCGEGTQRQLLQSGAGLRGLDRILLTHAHLDHVLGLPGLISTLGLLKLRPALEIVGSAQTLDMVEGLLRATVWPAGPPPGCGLRRIGPNEAVPCAGLSIASFPVKHRETDSRGYVFSLPGRHALDPVRLDAIGIPAGKERAALARGETVTLADGREVAPESVSLPFEPGLRLAVIGDAEDAAALVPAVRGADALIVEATFLQRDAALARARGHLTAAGAADLAAAAGVGQLLLTHISGRYDPAEIHDEASRRFERSRVVSDFDRILLTAAERNRS